MENIFNTTSLENDKKPEFKISEFDIQDTNNLIICVINAPKGKVKISSSMTLTSEDGKKTTSVPLGHALLTGHPKEILEQLLMGAGSILASGIKKNQKDAPKIIVPEEKKIIKKWNKNMQNQM